MAKAKNNWPATVTTNQNRVATLNVVLATESSCQRRGNALVITAVLILVSPYQICFLGADSYEAPASALLLYAFVKRTRTSQKTSNISGRMAGIKSRFVLRTTSGNTCCWPRKKEPVAINHPKHMRQR